jgi:hypothetical protein
MSPRLLRLDLDALNRSISAQFQSPLATTRRMARLTFSPGVIRNTNLRRPRFKVEQLEPAHEKSKRHPPSGESPISSLGGISPSAMYSSSVFASAGINDPRSV